MGSRGILSGLKTEPGPAKLDRRREAKKPEREKPPVQVSPAAIRDVAALYARCGYAVEAVKRAGVLHLMATHPQERPVVIHVCEKGFPPPRIRTALANSPSLGCEAHMALHLGRHTQVMALVVDGWREVNWNGKQWVWVRAGRWLA